MNGSLLARFTAICRVGIGGALLVRPNLVTRPWVGRDADRTGAVVLGRALAARDLGIALGTLAAAGNRAALRPWLAAALLADGTDFAATLATRDELPSPGRDLVLGVAGGAVALGLVALATLDEG